MAAAPKCPFDQRPMASKDSAHVTKLVTGASGAMANLLRSAGGKTRAKYFQCPQCRFIGMFEKNSAEV
jgi:hypothetical protein